MFVVVASWLFTKNFRGLAIFPFIILKENSLKSNSTLINHEKIHIRQQLELLWVIFFVWYGIEFLVRLIQFKNAYEAYQNISFEKEAYQNDTNLNYLKQRKFWKFAQYL